jgi:4-alpha-glucanotransferase
MASHSGSRSVEERYQYFIRGRQLIIIEQKSASGIGLNAGGSVPINDVLATGDDAPPYQAPSETITKGLMLEYTSIPDMSGMNDESDDVPLTDVLALSVVDYIKGAVAEEPALREYYMDKFNKRVVRYVEGRTGGLRRALGNAMMR